MRTRRWVALALGVTTLGGCDVPDPPPVTGGTTIVAGPCGRGVVSVAQDVGYASTNVSLVGWDGAVLSASVLRSSLDPTDLRGASLSGDVVVPTMPLTGDHLVLLQRTPDPVLTWLAVDGGAVLGQLALGTGFSSDAQDYVELPAASAGGPPARAYVTRYLPNPAPGARPFDGGSDVLVLDVHDLANPAIQGRIDLGAALAGEAPAFHPYPNRAVLAGGVVYVLLSAYAEGYGSSASSRVVALDPATDRIVGVTVLTGMHACLGLARSASGASLAVTCTGLSLASLSDIDHADLSQAGVVLLHAGARLEEARRWPASAFGVSPPGQAVAFASESLLVFSTTGSLGANGTAPRPDRALALDVTTGKVSELFETATAFRLGEPRCSPSCPTCFVADAEAGVLRRFQVVHGALDAMAPVAPDPQLGSLLPHYLDAF